MREHEHSLGSMRDFLRVVRKHKLMISAIFLGVVLLVTAVTLLMPPVYQADSSVLVKFGREYLNSSEVGENRQVEAVGQQEMVNTEVQVLASRDLIERVISKLKVESIYPELIADTGSKIKPADAAIFKFRKNLSVEGITKSNVIQVSFKHKDPQIAAKATNLLVEFYKEKHLQVFSDPQSSFLEAQLAEYKQKLDESEGNLQAFKQKNNVFSLDEQMSLLLRQRAELDASYKETSNHVGELKHKLATVQGQMSDAKGDRTLYTASERDKIIVEAKSRLLALQLNEQELLKKYKENNRLVVSNRAEIQIVEDFLKKQENDITDKVRAGSPVYQSIQMDLMKTEAELNSYTAKSASIKKQLGQVDAKIQGLDSKSLGLINLKRDVAVNEKNYNTYLSRYEDARILDDMNRQKLSNVSIISAATVPAVPVSPNKVLNITLGIFLGIVFGLGYAFTREKISTGLRVPDIADERLGLPVLTTVTWDD